MFSEALRNFIHREVLRVLDRRTRRTPCQVSSYNGQTHTVKVTLLPEGTLTGWMQIETLQVGMLVAPNIGDFGWVEFHENDRRAGVFMASVHNNNAPPPQAIEAGEFFYKNAKGQSIYFKNDGTVTLSDGAGSSSELNGQGNINVKANIAVNVSAPAINLGSGEGPLEPVLLATNQPSTVLKAQ